MTRFLMMVVLASCVFSLPASASVVECLSYVEVTNDESQVFYDDFSSQNLDAWSSHTSNIYIQPATSTHSGYCACLDRTKSVCDLDADASIADPRKVELKVGVRLPRAEVGETLSRFSLYLRSGATGPQRPVICVYIVEQQSGGYTISIDCGITGHWITKKAQGVEIQPGAWTDITVRLDATKGDLAILVNDTERQSLKVNKDDFTSIASIGIKNHRHEVRTAPKPTPKPPDPTKPPAEDLVTSLNGVGRGATCVDDVVLTKDGSVLFYDDFESGTRDKWPGSIGGSVKCCPRGCCLILQPEKNLAWAALRLPFDGTGVVELSAWMWLPQLAGQATAAASWRTSAGLILAAEGKTPEIWLSVGPQKSNPAYVVEAASTNRYDKTRLRSDVLLPETWYRLTLQIDFAKQKATALVNGKAQSTVGFDGRDFTKMGHGWVDSSLGLHPSVK